MAEPSPDPRSYGEPGRPAIQKAPDAFRTISEVSADLDIPQHVLRFWEGKFTQIKPLKRGGGRRYYRPDDVELLRGIQHLLYGDGYTIKGVQKLLREHGVKFVAAAGRRRLEQGARPRPGPTLLKPAPPVDRAADESDETGLSRPLVEPMAEVLPAALPPSGDRRAAAARLLSHLKAMRRDYDLKLQAAKNGRL
jgi:DNA-binding transcriptional MerR regulator